jgi:CTP:phosphocholine cytidylyltransferase-like protein
MEQIYYWIGLSVFLLSATIGSVIIVGYLLKELLDYLGKKFKILWVMVEFAYYKKEFMEWVKDKKRHPKSQ